MAKKIATSESMGVTPMTSDVIPPKNAFTRGLTQDAEGLCSGQAQSRAEQYATRSKLVSNYFDRFGEYNPDDVVKSLTTTLRGGRMPLALLSMTSPIKWVMPQLIPQIP